MATSTESPRREMARRAGQALASQRGPEYYREIGRRGGRKTVERHGKIHMQRIGKNGFRKVVSMRHVDSEGNLWSSYTWLLWRLYKRNWLPRQYGVEFDGVEWK